uniref:Late endosomal/lysosomal adaptor and MAPK and MTOR activator 4 n=1 Tax=Daphnia galeata TaxID=27404 RepID=A0A8J2RQS2_9CRUS|nr:unnamed protein product [Daphnia galeata]
MDSLPNQLGYLLLDEDGAVIASNGDLENDERIGGIIVKMLRTAHKQELGLNDEKDGFQRMTINYPDHCYIVCVSNKRIHIAKRLVSPASEAIA